MRVYVLHILVDGWKHICIHFFKYTCRTHTDCMQNVQFQKPDIIRSGGMIGMHGKKKGMYTYYILYMRSTQDIKIICVYSGEIKGKAVR